ncbi:MAG: rod shape-determining protein MreD [Candidatus Marinimicrobia bacterium]|nr:rod shape-determining protein MreD [Candidatus Neomarinimicrobiota bacterium]|tara:strand:- start:288 stop:779 length:492 start_codon:yes stop_codon:yes gene_type:complete
MVNRILIAAAGLGVLLLQILLSDFLTIRGLRPDFMLIYVIIVSMRSGSLAGIVAGFSLGLVEDFLSTGSLMGLAPLTKSLSGFMIGRLRGRYITMNPILFHLIWISVVAIHFFVYIYVNFQHLLEADALSFWLTYAYSVLYTMIFLAAFQFIRPFSSIKAAPN